MHIHSVQIQIAPFDSHASAFLVTFCEVVSHRGHIMAEPYMFRRADAGAALRVDCRELSSSTVGRSALASDQARYGFADVKSIPKIFMACVIYRA